MPLARIHTMLAVILLGVAGQIQAQSPALKPPVLQRDLTLGCESCSGPLQFGNIWELALSPTGEMVVVDRDAPMIREFDADGRARWQGGRKGQGPGEYLLVLRAAYADNGNLVVADMTGRRVTSLGVDRKVAKTTPLTMFATSAGADARGTLALAAETPRGALVLVEWRAGSLRPLALPVADSALPLAKNSSVARASTGIVAVAMNSEDYRIVRFDSVAARLPDITRAIARVRRTPAEVNALRARVERNRRQMASMEGARANSTARRSVPSTVTHLPVSIDDLTLKPHIAVDGLRYDPQGRLWVRTMRGDESSTVFDVFGTSGAFLGSVTMQGDIQLFAFGGRWMLTSFENADGVPQVSRWVVK